MNSDPSSSKVLVSRLFTQKLVHFYMLITLKQKKKQVVEVCEKTVYGEKQSFIEWTYVVDAH